MTNAVAEDFLRSELRRCLPWIAEALKYSGGTHTPTDVVESILKGHMQLWPGKQACAVTEIVVYPNKKVLHVFLAAGDMDNIVDMQKSAEIWAKSQNCQAMTIAGRKGWSRVLKDHGYQEKFVTLAKELK
jgi:hypothetical protein